MDAGIKQEIIDWKKMLSSEPDVILLAVRCDVRYTAEEFELYKTLKKELKIPKFKTRLVLAFTFGDRQDKDIETELQTVCGELQSVLKDASKRYVVFNNRASWADRNIMTEKFFTVLSDMSKYAGSCIVEIKLI